MIEILSIGKHSLEFCYSKCGMSSSSIESWLDMQAQIFIVTRSTGDSYSHLSCRDLSTPDPTEDVIVFNYGNQDKDCSQREDGLMY